MNFFYDLPEDLICLIYKKVYNGVMEQLKNRPGNFAFMKNSEWAFQLEKDYHTIDKLNAWEFLKTCTGFFDTVINRPSQFYIIYNILQANHRNGTHLKASMANMQMISTMGWVKYKILFTVAHV